MTPKYRIHKRWQSEMRVTSRIWLVLSGKSHICQKEGILLANCADLFPSFKFIGSVEWFLSARTMTKSCGNYMYLLNMYNHFLGSIISSKIQPPKLSVVYPGHRARRWRPRCRRRGSSGGLRCSGLQGVCSKAPCLGVYTKLVHQLVPGHAS